MNLNGREFGIKEEVGRTQLSFWSIWHQAVAVNDWCAKISANISGQCIYCLTYTRETIKHRFWGCVQAQQVWKWTIQIIFVLSNGTHHPFQEFD